MIHGTLNRTPNLFVLLIVISFILLATAIRYAQAQPGCCEPATPPPVHPNAGSMANATSGMESNSTGNAQENNSTRNGTHS
jgi:hypothetical protein